MGIALGTEREALPGQVADNCRKCQLKQYLLLLTRMVAAGRLRARRRFRRRSGRSPGTSRVMRRRSLGIIGRLLILAALVAGAAEVYGSFDRSAYHVVTASELL